MNANAPSSRDVQRPRVALFVDGENFPVSLAGTAILRAARLGAITIKCVVGDAGRLNGWNAAPGFRVVHAGTGKNAADIRLVIEALEVAYLSRADIFVLAASDGDYCHLAFHLVERGWTVVGLGEAKTPDRLRKACTRFDEVAPAQPVVAQPAPALAAPALSLTQSPPVTAPPPAVPADGPDLESLAARVIATHAGSDGWLSLQQFGARLSADHGRTRKDCGRNTWAAWFNERPARFRVAGNTHTLKVRLLQRTP